MRASESSPAAAPISWAVCGLRRAGRAGWRRTSLPAGKCGGCGRPTAAPSTSGSRPGSFCPHALRISLQSTTDRLTLQLGKPRRPVFTLAAPSGPRWPNCPGRRDETPTLPTPWQPGKEPSAVALGRRQRVVQPVE
ncbi:hypothetical protein DL89DRAFT_146223 [Linderina pennispora]|uniref:Uncharacterized protein n=1 Tax=Linderina pennispora TaxID=61395 RepID=A0A1Y1VUI7_9FUNG|nr:uncharacterized protein DL89DRAFT_146223 [Linderina pennispora]ORX64959.1 hypothetical protein DL89DRAFT_146223 [Linderina pennispora]